MSSLKSLSLAKYVMLHLIPKLLVSVMRKESTFTKFNYNYDLDKDKEIQKDWRRNEGRKAREDL